MSSQPPAPVIQRLRPARTQRDDQVRQRVRLRQLGQGRRGLDRRLNRADAGDQRLDPPAQGRAVFLFRRHDVEHRHRPEA